LIDLHSHTTASDGTASPSGLVALAVERGLEALAITDHDTLAGYEAAVPHARAVGLELICGVELSTRPHVTERTARPPSVHLLGYFLNGEPSAVFRDWLCSQQESRRERNRVLIARLQELGVAITLGEVEEIGGSLTGRPHFARILQQKGYVQSRQEAFDLYLADDAKAGVERDEPGLLEGIDRIREGGGLASLAHPVRLESCELPFLRTFLKGLAEQGMQGLEVYHSDHSDEQTACLRAMAVEFGMVETGGSDYHGGNKPGVELGTGRGNLALPLEVLEKMRRMSGRVSVTNKEEIPTCKSL
jgi:predicted metal-dependent phosphoesterase TrpH